MITHVWGENAKMGSAERGLREKAVRHILTVIRILLVEGTHVLLTRQRVRFQRRLMNTAMRTMIAKWILSAIGSQHWRNNKEENDVRKCTISKMAFS
jgi:hypothetical protein